MKNIIKKIVLLIICSFFITGCLNKDDFSDDYTYTTIYPVEYATRMIYGDFSNVESIYPDGIDSTEFVLTEKMMNNYSEGNKFIYAGLSDERLIARDLLNKNNNIEIVDAMKGMDYLNQIEELWLDPSNFLMICRNIKSTLIDYEDNIYIKEKIEKNYQSLKEEISILDVDIYNLSKNGNYKTILVTSNVFNFLAKYGITVISLDSTNESMDKSLSAAKNMISEGKIDYIYTLKGESISDTTNTFINDYKIHKIEIDPFTTITNEQRINGETYISLIDKIINELKKELFK